ncbi:MAG: hypothetical protein JWP36_47 [Paucimonas sp.]|nr:hypothetical protein [Paucimonas sp.]
MTAFEWLSGSSLAQALAAYPTLYIFVNAAHIVSIGLVVGSILPLDLRVLGLFRGFPLGVLGPFLSRTAMVGVALAALTGITLFTAKAPEYAHNPAFQTKMALLLAGIANALLLHANPAWRLALQTGQASASVKAAAGFSLLGWIATLVAGRWIGFL